MPHKAALTRVTDTTNYITNWNGTIAMPGNVNADIVNMINAQFPQVPQLPFNTMSEELSVETHSNWFTSGNEDQRHMRRAIALIYKAIGRKLNVNFQGANLHSDAMTMPSGNLAEAMDVAMIHGAASASPAGITWVFNHFAADPLTFLRRLKIFIRGSTAGRSKVDTAPVPPVALGHYQNVVPFLFYYSVLNDWFEVSQIPTTPPLDSHPFTAVSIPAVLWSAVPGRGNVVNPPALPAVGFDQMLGIEMTGSLHMVTTQFTGCAFCYATDGGNPYASHISPGNIGTGAVLAAQLMGGTPNVAAALMSNYPGGPIVPEIFGSGAGNFAALNGGNAFYPALPAYQWMSIFGRFVGPNWELYTQSVDQTGAIMWNETRRIR